MSRSFSASLVVGLIALLAVGWSKALCSPVVATSVKAQAQTRALLFVPAQGLRQQTRVVESLKILRLLKHVSPTNTVDRSAEHFCLRYTHGEDRWSADLVAQERGNTADLFHQDATGSKLEIMKELMSEPDLGACLQLYYFAPDLSPQFDVPVDGALAGSVTFAQLVRDLDQVWDAGLSQGIKEYEKALGMLGEVVALRADAWQSDSRVNIRLVFIMKEAAMVKRFQLVLALAKQLGKVATQTAVQKGSMDAGQGEVFQECLSTLKVTPRDTWVNVVFSFDPTPILHATSALPK